MNGNVFFLLLNHFTMQSKHRKTRKILHSSLTLLILKVIKSFYYVKNATRPIYPYKF